MLKMVCKSAYVLYQVITSGSETHGLQVTEGRQKGLECQAKKPEFYWFKNEDEAGLVCRAASLIRAKLDKEYHRPEVQIELFTATETATSLFDEAEEHEHPLLTKAYQLAQELPSTVKWKRVLMAADTACHLCQSSIEARGIAHCAQVNTPSGMVLHIQCQACKAAEHKPAEVVNLSERSVPQHTPTQSGAA